MKNRLVLFLLAAAGLSAAPVTNDLWDSSQAGFSGPVLLNGGGSACGSTLNILGGSTNVCNGFSNTFDAAGFSQLSIGWGTAAVTVGSFALFSPSNFLGSEVNEIIGIRLYTLDSNGLNPVLFYDSGVISHNPPNDGSTPLLSVTLPVPVTSSNWRLDIVDQRSAGGDAPIYRIIELDAFAPSADVPEPATGLIAAIGMAYLFYRRRHSL
ncbi:MAG: PEP-CTERM sorting domain-containing protein [Bryobacterales bacterium]|nr:PEP-CTERM sorting domain-containing protein [Bryobacterales bacterium]